MKVWYVENENYSGVFDTKAKAMKSVKNFLKDNQAYNIEITSHKEGADIFCEYPLFNLNHKKVGSEKHTIFVKNYELNYDYAAE